VLATALNVTPRARRSTINEGAEKAWFYVAIWTVTTTQLFGWAMWRLGRYFDLAPQQLNISRLLVFVLVAAITLALALPGRLPRTARYYFDEKALRAGAEA